MPTDTDPESLRHDMHCILLQCYRDRPGIDIFLPTASQADITSLAAQMARRLGPLIGGRYIPKRDDRAARDAAVWQAFDGRNHKDVMRQYNISRRLLYAILSRKRRNP